MKIAMIGTGWYPETAGGLEKYFHGLAYSLMDAGDSVDLFVNGNPRMESERGHAYSIGGSKGSLLKRMVTARRSYASHFREPYDVINIHFAMNALPLIPFIRHNTPRVVNFQGPWGAEGRVEGGSNFASAIKEALERFVYSRADRFIVLSSAFKEILSSYGIALDRIHVIPMGIDCSFFKPALDKNAVRDSLNWPRNIPIFFTARRLINRVGITELLQAAKILKLSGQRFVIKIAGKGPMHQELQTKLKDLEIEDCVELLGFISEEKLVEAYQAADVTILPTQSLEGFGTIISESLACGTPVIVTPIGGMPEAVSPLDEALICRSASASDIAERLAAVLKGTLTLPDVQMCQSYALANYEWSVVVKQVRDVFAIQ